MAYGRVKGDNRKPHRNIVADLARALGDRAEDAVVVEKVVDLLEEGWRMRR